MTQPFTGRDKTELEAVERGVLAPYALLSSDARRRFVVVDSGRTLAYRTDFQRDRDRIVHALAFRRLKHKTQVWVPYEGDHHRTRLTHTLEVAQIGRTAARALGLNEDLVEAIALGHDLGQPPFGAAGQEVLAALLRGEESLDGVDREVLAASGGFLPNYQSLRVVDRLEQRYDHPGLNLTDPVREGIWKCGAVDGSVVYPDWVEEGLEAGGPATLEAQLVRVADRLARLTHDLEDGIRAEAVELEAVERLRLGEAVLGKLGDAYRHEHGRYRRQNALVRGMIHLLVSDVIVHTSGRLRGWLQSWEARGDGTVGARDGAADANPGNGQEVDDAKGRRAEKAKGGRAAKAKGRRAENMVGRPAARPAEPPRFDDGTVGFSDTIAELVDELEAFVEAQVYRSFAVSRLDGRGRTFIKGLFSAYYRDPLQLDDYVLLRYRALAGGPYLRDLPGTKVQEEVVKRYHGRPQFVRLIADHIAGMSDTYALKEYERLYMPFPEAESR